MQSCDSLLVDAYGAAKKQSASKLHARKKEPEDFTLVFLKLALVTFMRKHTYRE